MQSSDLINLMLHSGAASLCLFMIGLLIIRLRHSGNWRVSSQLSLLTFFTVDLLTLLQAMFMELNGHIAQPHLTGLAEPLWPLFFVSIWLYTKATVEKRKTDFFLNIRRHAIWLPISFVLLLPYYFLDTSEKLQLLNDTASLTQPANSLLFAIMGYELYSILTIILAVIYTLKALKRVLDHQKEVRDHFSSLEGKALKWLLFYLSCFLLVLIMDQIVFAFFDYEVFTGPVDGLYELLLVGVMAFYSARQQEVYGSIATKRASRDDQTDLTKKNDPKIQPENTLTSKYARSALDKERAEKIAAKLHQAMTKKTLYRNPSLSLSILSGEVMVNENHISQTLNEYLGKTFFDYVNGWRIREAKSLLLSTELSVLEIAEDVGFNSRSTFNTAFKKFTACTPREYRKITPSQAKRT